MTTDEQKAREVLEYLENKLGYSIVTHRRTRKYVYPKKIFCKITTQITGLSLECIAEFIDVTHATVLHHVNTFNYLNENSQDLYNQCILDLNLDLKLIERKRMKISNAKNDRLNSMMVRLRSLNDSDLYEFDEFRLKPFLKLNKNRILTEN